MILIGSGAVGLGLYQYVCREFFRGWFLDVGVREVWRGNAWLLVATASRGASWLIPFAAAWTVVLPWLRARGPRRRWRRVWREPGMAACLAAGAGWLWGGAALGVAACLSHVRPHQPAAMERWVQTFFDDALIAYVGLAVASVWMVQACSGRWRRPVDAIDLLGRLVGVAWVVIGLVWALRAYFDLV
jgi:hypothetical protein